jgi:murein DD-endopeptidase MepM/ murein hydrolase activator NlpD
VSDTGRDGGYGLMIELDHGNGFKTRYAHLSKILVSRGQKVKRGDVIGLVGNTGHSTGSHLHYEVIFRQMHRDPLQYVLPDDMSYD